MKKYSVLVILVLFLVTPLSMAAQGGYIGASIGSASVDDPAGLIDDSDTGMKIFGGYQILENLAVEVFYADFGEPSNNVVGVTLSSQFTGFGVEAVGIIPFDKLSLFGKAGLISWEEDYKVNGTTVFTDDGVDPTFGIGLGYEFTDSLAIRAEYEFYAIEDSAGEIDVDLFSVGLQYNF